eukprot:TRINITY_DN498_c0_g1_i1.p1 TRINITY_DN498_c0_g1~~TRINITY_DN498_c0_g1_i1.p1  ORF type:complete len:273 (-),score=130.81 TRINITY_DN498_c0_g1_i1:55-873(-)
MASTRKIAVVTGANKGIGFAICEKLCQFPNFSIILAARNTELGETAVANLKSKYQNNEIYYQQLEITDEQSCSRFAQLTKERFGSIDILINNAGMAFKGNAFDEHVARTTINTNYYGTIRICNHLIPLLNVNSRVVNVSSTAGRQAIVSEQLRNSFNNPNLTLEELSELIESFISSVADRTYSAKGWPQTTYGISKLGMSTYTQILARQLANDSRNILVNACCPGWVRTDMAGPNAPLTPEQGAETPVFLATLPLTSTETGLFFSDKKQKPW